MANVTTVFETKLENYTDVANQAFTGRIDVAAVVGDTELPIPTSSSDGFPFFQMRQAIVAVGVAGGDVKSVSLWAGYELPNTGFIWTLMSGATPIILADGDTGGWNTDAGRPDRIAVSWAIDAGAPVVSVLIGGNQ